MISSFNVALPGSGANATVEAEATEGEQVGGESFSSEGGRIWIRNTGTVNALVGGPNDSAPVYPLNTADPPLGPMDLGPNDTVIAKIASGSTAGQLTVLKVEK